MGDFISKCKGKICKKPLNLNFYSFVILGAIQRASTPIMPLGRSQ